MSINEPSEPVDLDQQIHVIDAFNMPRLHFDYHRKAFVASTKPTLLFGTATDKAEMFLDRLNLVKQRLLRNERFSPTSMHIDREAYIRITPIKALLGQDGDNFTLFGMLTQLEEGKIFLEDEDANIQLNLSSAEFDSGLFTDGTFVIVNGNYHGEYIFHAKSISLPPTERREITDSLFSHVDFNGLPKSLVDDTRLNEALMENDNIFFVILSDVFLDQPKVINGLRTIFHRYETNKQLPFAFILIGNFSSENHTYMGLESDQYAENFSAFADVISEYPDISEHSHFIFVPGSRDPWGGDLLPQPPIPPIFTKRMLQKLKRSYFATNPCRIRFCTQDILIYREDILSKLWRNALLNPNTAIEPNPVIHLVRTLVDQGHICPLPLSKRPIYWTHDHALRLYPLPHTIILADQCENYSINYEGAHCINPGSFPNSDYTFTVYYPSSQLSEKW
ncbi:DNA polymerase alpha/epsilon subunit B-domain-containing protein [Cunninghamella echinulata]|nr:DNA polymerase alpha/epsilon subunit B-domain-containing protein [Cunninghamella echinulata]